VAQICGKGIRWQVALHKLFLLPEYRNAYNALCDERVGQCTVRQLLQLQWLIAVDMPGITGEPG
jgi:hypothetical protein